MKLYLHSGYKFFFDVGGSEVEILIVMQTAPHRFKYGHKFHTIVYSSDSVLFFLFYKMCELGLHQRLAQYLAVLLIFLCVFMLFTDDFAKQFQVLYQCTLYYLHNAHAVWRFVFIVIHN